MKIFEITRPQNVTEPEEPVDQQPEVQPEPAQDAPVEPQAVPAEPQRKPRYKWGKFPSPTDFGMPDWNDTSPEAEEKRSSWYGGAEAKNWSAAHKEFMAAQKAAMAQHAGVSEDDFDMTVEEFPNPYYKEGGTDDEEDPNYEPEVISIGVDYDYGYHGKYYAATRYDPAEYPDLEIDIKRVVDLDNGEDITKKVDLQEIEKYIEDKVPSWEEDEADRRDQAAIDRYEANRDDYYESLTSIKKLSGLK
jgi:hypothetical protein